MNISSYKDVIKYLNPLADSGFKYTTLRWKNLDPSYHDYVREYENSFISRQVVINSFELYYSGLVTWQTPFLLTMIWGFADTGYGTHRTNNYLASDRNISLIIAAFEAIKTGDLEFAYKNLQTIKGLNISYISKILYFATKAAKYEEYALIYDIRVANSLIRLTTTPEIFEIVKINPSSKFSHYKKYNSLMHKYSREHELKAECLEMFLFDQKF